jgi:hypothetical protein
MRVVALGLLVLGLSIYTWKDRYKSLCGLIVLTAVLEHKDMPRAIFDVPGLNPWNLAFFIVLVPWVFHRSSSDRGGFSGLQRHTSRPLRPFLAGDGLAPTRLAANAQQPELGRRPL